MSLRSKTKRVPCSHCSGLGFHDEVPGAQLRKLREKSGKPLRVLAKIAGVSVVYLSDVERDRRRCTERVLQLYETLEG